MSGDGGGRGGGSGKGVFVTVLWEKRDRNGQTYYAGPLSRDTGVAIFPVKKKDGEGTSPEFSVWVIPRRERDES